MGEREKEKLASKKAKIFLTHRLIGIICCVGCNKHVFELYRRLMAN